MTSVQRRTGSLLYGQTLYGDRAIVQRIPRESSQDEIASDQRIAKDSTAHKQDNMWRSGVRMTTE